MFFFPVDVVQYAKFGESLHEEESSWNVLVVIQLRLGKKGLIFKAPFTGIKCHLEISVTSEM